MSDDDECHVHHDVRNVAHGNLVRRADFNTDFDCADITEFMSSVRSDVVDVLDDERATQASQQNLVKVQVELHVVMRRYIAGRVVDETEVPFNTSTGRL